jgi:hypothetical protein
MALKQRIFILAVISSVAAASAAASPALAQTPALAGGADGAPPQTAESIPDFTGVIWAHPMLGFESPLSGPGPVVNTKRTRTGTSDSALLVGDYTNPILKPAAAEIVKKRGEISQSGVAFPDPDAMCMYEPVPYIFWNFEIQILQRPDKVTILYNHDHEFREVSMNQPHPAKVVPSAHGDSVGHYEGDTLVIDTVGVKVGPYTMIDRLGTPYTEALHVVERYRLIDYEAAVEAQARGFKEWNHSLAYDVDPDYKGKGLQLEFTVEDEGVFTMPWKGIITYRRALRKFWDERICAENITNYEGRNYYSDKDAKPPRADKPDF